MQLRSANLSLKSKEHSYNFHVEPKAQFERPYGQNYISLEAVAELDQKVWNGR